MRSLYPSKNVLRRCYIALKRFYRKGRLTIRKKNELSAFRRQHPMSTIRDRLNEYSMIMNPLIFNLFLFIFTLIVIRLLYSVDFSVPVYGCGDMNVRCDSIRFKNVIFITVLNSKTIYSYPK